MSYVLCNCERCSHHDGDGCALEHVEIDHGICTDLEPVISHTKEDKLRLLIAKTALESTSLLEVNDNV